MKKSADDFVLTQVEDLIRFERAAAWRRFADVDLTTSLQRRILSRGVSQTAFHRYRRRLLLAYLTIVVQAAILVGVLLFFRPRRDSYQEWRRISVVLEQIAALGQRLPVAKPLTAEEILSFELGWVLRRAGYSMQPRQLSADELQHLLTRMPDSTIPEVEVSWPDVPHPERMRLEERIKNLLRDKKLQLFFNNKFKKT